MRTAYFYLAYAIEKDGKMMARVRRLTSDDNVSAVTKDYAFSNLQPTKKRAIEVVTGWNEMFFEQGRHMHQKLLSQSR